MRFLLLFLLSTSLAIAAPQQKTKKETPKPEKNLLQVAQEELNAPAALAPKTPSSGATISTAEALHETKDPGKFLSSELRLEVQSYQPKGQGRLSATETYSLSNVPSVTMVGFGYRYYFNEAQKNGESQTRFGFGPDISFSQNRVNLISSTGVRYNDVRLSSLLPVLKASGDWFVPRLKMAAINFELGLGRAILAQSSTAAALNRSSQRSFFEAGIAAKLYWNDIFARVGFSYRDVLNSKGDISVQESNTLLALGLGF